MKRHLLALLTFLISLTFAAEALGQITYNTVDGEVVSADNVDINWTNTSGGSGRVGQITGVGQAVPYPPHLIAAAISPARYPDTFRRVVDAEIELTVTGGIVTFSDGRTLIPGGTVVAVANDQNPNKTTQEDTAGNLVVSWVLPSEPGTYEMTATVVGADPNADVPFTVTTDTLYATAVLLPPEEDASERHDQRRTLTTDTTLRVIDGINNNLRRHLETLRRSQPE